MSGLVVEDRTLYDSDTNIRLQGPAHRGTSKPIYYSSPNSFHSPLGEHDR